MDFGEDETHSDGRPAQTIPALLDKTLVLQDAWSMPYMGGSLVGLELSVHAK